MLGPVPMPCRLLCCQVEALKTRKSAKQMVDFMRSVNPQLAQALTDDRDEVRLVEEEAPCACAVAQ